MKSFHPLLACALIAGTGIAHAATCNIGSSTPLADNGSIYTCTVSNSGYYDVAAYGANGGAGYGGSGGLGDLCALRPGC